MSLLIRANGLVNFVELLLAVVIVLLAITGVYLLPGRLHAWVPLVLALFSTALLATLVGRQATLRQPRGAVLLLALVVGGLVAIASLVDLVSGG